MGGDHVDNDDIDKDGDDNDDDYEDEDHDFEVEGKPGSQSSRRFVAWSLKSRLLYPTSTMWQIKSSASVLFVSSFLSTNQHVHICDIAINDCDTQGAQYL